jgi:hypothetical protein
MAENHSQGSVTIGKIDCPDCGQRRRARVLIRDEEGRPALVCCLGCDRFFPPDDVDWLEK